MFHFLLVESLHLLNEKLEILAELKVHGNSFFLDIFPPSPFYEVAQFVVSRLHGIDELLEPLLLEGH